MRLDKYLSSGGELSRTGAKAAVRGGRVSVNGIAAVSPDMKIDPSADLVTLDGEAIVYEEFVYIMLNKPAGTVSATEDGRDKTVIDLLPDKYKKIGLFPCGRLDKDTVGLMILTNDGLLAHDLLSPKHHVEKVYYFQTERPLDRIDELEAGVRIAKDLTTKPCRIEKLGEKSGNITLTEGKYHQIKLMLEAVGNKVTYLKRIEFAGIPLDASIKESAWRPLKESEISLLKSHNRKTGDGT